MSKRPNPILRLFSSIWFGIILLTLILLYASVASALPQVRGAVEMTEMEIFGHWTFGLLILVFSVNLIVATLRRVRFRIVNLGVLTVHTGLLTLVIGSYWYFGTKVEGDVLLISPKIEILNGKGATASAVDHILAEPGSVWARSVPMMGGDVRIEVENTASGEATAVQSADVRVQIGSQPPKSIKLVANGEPQLISGDRWSIRLKTAPAQTAFYDDEAAALYYRELDAGGQPVSDRRYAVIEGLPRHRERYLDEGYVLQDRAGNDVPSKRTAPVLRLGPLTIPTGWYEHWRMPIPVETPDLPFDVQVTGFVPYLADLRTVAAGGGGEVNPAATITLSAGNQSVTDTMFALDAGKSLVQRTATPIEFTAVDSPEELEQLLTPMTGPQELHIEVLDPPAKLRVPAVEGQKITVPDTNYEITVKSLSPSWPLMTAGFEGVNSPMASIDVTNGEKRYNRTVIQRFDRRFPNLTQDIDEQGTRHRDGPYDPNLIVRYRSAPTGWWYLIARTYEPESAPLILAAFDESGRVARHELPKGKAQPVEMSGMHLHVRVDDYFKNGQERTTPIIEPVEFRRPNMTNRTIAAVRFHFKGKGELAGWEESRWCQFSTYTEVDARPFVVQPPGSDRKWELICSRKRYNLDFAIVPRMLSTTMFPGGRSVESWRSDFYVRPEGGGPLVAGMVQTNDTFSFGGWTFFQSGAAQDHWSYTILGVGNRNGIWPMTLGCVLITLGCMYAFYVKPVIKRRQLNAKASGRQDSADREERVAAVGGLRQPQPELVNARG